MCDNEKLEIIFQVLLSCMHKGNHSTDYLQEEIISNLIKSVTNLFKAESPLLRLSGSFVIVGDIHGNIDFLIRLFQELHYPNASSSHEYSKNESDSSINTSQSHSTKYLFLGDYIDRGKNSIEVILLLYSLKVLFPTQIYLLRGNHETNQFKKNSTFKNECLNHLSTESYKRFLGSFSFLPLAAVVNNSILCLHGGISPYLETLEDIQNTQMPLREIDGTTIASDILWSDPRYGIDYFKDSTRGLGCFFSQDALGVFLEVNNLKTLIRGHEFYESGYSWDFDHDCLTLCSSTDFNGTNSSAAVAMVDLDGSIEIRTFQPLTSDEKSRFRVIFPEWLLTNLSSTEKTLDNEFVEFVEYAEII